MLNDPIALDYPTVGVGQVPAELVRAVRLYRKRKPRRVLEIGVWYGGTLHEWLRYAVPHATVVAVDIDHRDPDSYAEWRKATTNLIVLTGRSQDLIEEMREHGPYDWIFIDGDHGAAAVYADLNAALTMAARGSVILLHDIDSGGSDTTGPRNAFDTVSRSEFVTRTQEFIADPAGTGYPIGSAHGIGVLYL